MNPDELKDRTKQFALRVLKLVAALPKTIEGRAIANQLVRCGTSVAANYRAACRARSKAEFIAKIGVVLEEADEGVFWIELLGDTGTVKAARLNDLLREAKELTAIFTASQVTARNGKGKV